jgi:hypothetical protein
VVDPREDQLHRAPLRTDHEIDAARVAVEARADLVVHNPHESDRPDAQHEQQHVEQRAQRPRAQVAPGQLKEVH